MTDNSIPEELKSDHLFLLIGGNPLPNWVAARLLFRFAPSNDQQNKLYLVCSSDTVAIAQRLAKKLREQNFPQADYLEVADGSNWKEVYNAISGAVKKIKSGRIGFNYTGGTKVMSVYGYQAIRDGLAATGLEAPVFSYLDAATLQMYFENHPEPIFVGLHPWAGVTLKELFNLHDEYSFSVPNRDPIAMPIVEALEELHREKSGYATWRKWVTDLKGIHNKSKDDQTVSLPKLDQWPQNVFSVTKAIAKGCELSETTLDQICREGVWPPLNDVGTFISWLEGNWLESLVLDRLNGIAAKCFLNDWGQNIVLKTSRFEMQADLAAVRRYQLYFFTCWSGHNKLTAKGKLFEGFTRARQIGGDEAGAALVCMSDDPESIRQDIAQLWMEKRGRVRVFGREHLNNLQKHLTEWFHTEIPKQ